MADGYCKWYYENEGGLYDDIYMDLTFVDVFDKYGFDVPVDSLANAFAYAGYKLWHANQAARYNILNGIPAPASGHWKNNPHADDIDFQIEADFAGADGSGHGQFGLGDMRQGGSHYVLRRRLVRRRLCGGPLCFGIRL